MQPHTDLNIAIFFDGSLLIMTTLEPPHDDQNGIYDPDDVGLQDSPLLKPLRPRLQPTPSPSPEELESEDVRPLPSQGDAVLISLLGGGKALEVARRAGTENLAADDEMSTTHERSDNADNLGFLNADTVIDLHTRASNGTTRLIVGPGSITGKPNKLCPSPEPSTKFEKANILESCSISPQQGHSVLIADAPATNKVDDENPSTTNQPLISQSSQTRPDFQLRSSPSAGTPTSQPILSNSSYSTYSSITGFQCTYAGCTAKPFQTQYLLKSHANVHSSDRPYHCPVKDCPRGESGKGFKRKNEMTRHGLVHESPGYACPYCVDQRRRYPRPDNLQR